MGNFLELTSHKKNESIKHNFSWKSKVCNKEFVILPVSWIEKFTAGNFVYCIQRNVYAYHLKWSEQGSDLQGDAQAHKL